VQTQSRRASLLARQGQLAQARALIQQLPEPNAQEARRKLLAEVNLLREFKQYRPAYELMTGAVAQAPKDHELIYEKSILAEKLGRFEEMEALLRQILQIKPDYHAAYNALGYSLADRGLRLAEAKQLIQKALEFAPSDPYIQDSLAWVEFRLGNRQEALRVIEIAYKAKPDAEIAAHFGEILWSLGQRERALMIWREGLQLNADNETLQETLKRLQVQP
jgi:tetratricopeptide (TPR) repeat protein